MTATATSAVARRAAPATRRSLAWILSDSITIAWRNILAVVRNPQLLVIDTITPIMFVLLFAFVFGGAIQTPGVSYVTFLRPIAETNPVTVVVNAARVLFLGTADAGTVLLAAGWIGGIVAIFAPLAIWSYRRKG